MSKVIWYKRAEFLIPFAFVIGTHLGMFIMDYLTGGMQIESDLLLFLFYPEIWVFFMIVEPVSAWYQSMGWNLFWLDAIFLYSTVILMAFVYGWIGVGIVSLYKWVVSKANR